MRTPTVEPADVVREAALHDKIKYALFAVTLLFPWAVITAGNAFLSKLVFNELGKADWKTDLKDPTQVFWFAATVSAIANGAFNAAIWPLMALPKFSAARLSELRDKALSFLQYIAVYNLLVAGGLGPACYSEHRGHDGSSYGKTVASTVLGSLVTSLPVFFVAFLTAKSIAEQQQARTEARRPVVYAAPEGRMFVEIPQNDDRQEETPPSSPRSIGSA